MHIQTPKHVRNIPKIPPLSAPNTPVRKKNLGRHWTTLGDIGRHMSPSHAKNGGFRSHEAVAPVNRLFCNSDMQTIRSAARQSRIDLSSRQIRNSRSKKGKISFRLAATPATICPSLPCRLQHFKRPATSVPLAEYINAAFFLPAVPTKCRRSSAGEVPPCPAVGTLQ